MAPCIDAETDVLTVPWDELATLWRHKAYQCGPGSQEMLAVATLREIVRLVALMRPSARKSLRIVLPDRRDWPYGYFGKQQIAKLIELESR